MFGFFRKIFADGSTIQLSRKLSLVKEFNHASRDFPKADALLLIDVQREFCDPSGRRGNIDTEWTSRHIATAVPKIRDLQIPIYSIYFGYHDKPGSDVDFYQYEYHPTDILIRKTRDSAFRGSDIDCHLRKKKHKNLLVMGFNTSACVMDTVIDGLKNGYKMWLAADCIGNDENNPQNPKEQLKEMYNMGARFVTSGEALEKLAKSEKQKTEANAVMKKLRPEMATL